MIWVDDDWIGIRSRGLWKVGSRRYVFSLVVHTGLKVPLSALNPGDGGAVMKSGNELAPELGMKDSMKSPEAKGGVGKKSEAPKVSPF